MQPPAAHADPLPLDAFWFLSAVGGAIGDTFLSLLFCGRALFSTVPIDWVLGGAGAGEDFRVNLKRRVLTPAEGGKRGSSGGGFRSSAKRCRLVASDKSV